MTIKTMTRGAIVIAITVLAYLAVPVLSEATFTPERSNDLFSHSEQLAETLNVQEYVNNEVIYNLAIEPGKSISDYELWTGEQIDELGSMQEWTVTFNKPIDPSNVENKIRFYKDDHNIFPISDLKVASDNKVISFKPAENLLNGDYFLLLDSLKPESGNPLDPPVKVPFTVKDNTYPQFIWLDDYYKKQIQISDFSYPLGIYFSGEQLTSSVTLKNTGDVSKEIWVGASFRDQEQAWHDLPAKALDISPGDSLTGQLTWNVPDQIISGKYELVTALWDRSPGEPGAVRIADSSLEDQIRVYRNQDNFYSFDQSFWYKTSNQQLGRSALLRRNVLVEDNLLKIKHPQNTLQGGEIRTEAFKSFGSYEIRMKLPDAPSSITGFFLYKAPCFYYEIDIEIYNDSSGTIFFTTYAGGSKQKEYKTTLPFDPTKNFHNYRIDYYSDNLSFYVDDILMKSWDEGYPKEPMYLMLNSWYPSWLPGTPAAEDQYLEVDWIRY